MVICVGNLRYGVVTRWTAAYSSLAVYCGVVTRTAQSCSVPPLFAVYLYRGTVIILNWNDFHNKTSAFKVLILPLDIDIEKKNVNIVQIIEIHTASNNKTIYILYNMCHRQYPTAFVFDL